MKGLDIALDIAQVRWALITTDLVILTVLIVAFNGLQKMQKDYAQEYGKDIVEVRDFTLIIEKLP